VKLRERKARGQPEPPTAATMAAMDRAYAEQEREEEKARTELVADGARWRRVRGSKPWKPKQDGDVLVGRLLARSTRPGDNGSVYGVATVEGPNGPVTVSGVVITGLLDAAGELDPETRIRIVFTGTKMALSGRSYNDFDLYVEVGHEARKVETGER
jgi:hypothetical protein